MEKFVYIVRANRDMTEGRGPMIMEKAFVNIENARTYIKSKPGIMGSEQHCYNPLDKYGMEDWNGYDIIKMKIEDC